MINNYYYFHNKFTFVPFRKSLKLLFDTSSLNYVDKGVVVFRGIAYVFPCTTIRERGICWNSPSHFHCYALISMYFTMIMIKERFQSLQGMLHWAMFRATCLAIVLEDKLHEKLLSATAP